MLSEAKDAPAVRAQDIGKRYTLYKTPSERLKQLLWGKYKKYGHDHWALRDINLTVERGEVVGIVGRNGAGKSSLLQMVCGTVSASEGELAVQGRVAALLELGGGFDPNFTGMENIYMNAAVLGLKRTEVDAKLAEIVAFADIGDFIDQPVRTYSSGMFMRLAFAVATSVDPDILVIDEALSVGDGAFARKSFDRIMQLRDAGKTILFCSHSMYQVESLCTRAIWIESGRIKMQGSAAAVTSAYAASLEKRQETHLDNHLDQPPETAQAPVGTGRILSVTARADGLSGKELPLRSGKSDLELRVSFVIDPALPAPGVAFGISDGGGRTVASAISTNDAVRCTVDAQGHGSATVVFKQIPLLKGRYEVTSFLTTEDGLHPYELIMQSVILNVTQAGLEQGVVSLPHHWKL